MHKHQSNLTTIIISCVLLFCIVSIEARDQTRDGLQHELVFKRAASSSVGKRMAREDDQDNKISDEQVKQNEIDDRIVIVEPYKSIIQTTARFALAQTQVTKHINIDTAMNLLNDAGYLLSKPVILLKVLKIAAVTLATFLATLFFFPGAHKFAETAWENPMNALNLDRYLTNGLQERSVLAALGSKTDETLSRVGLQDNSCRQRSLCYLGEIVKCSFPNTAETVTKFASDNFSNIGFKDNVYARAFISGFVDRNCTGIGGKDQQEANNCLGNFFNSILSGAESRNRNRRK